MGEKAEREAQEAKNPSRRRRRRRKRLRRNWRNRELAETLAREAGKFARRGAVESKRDGVGRSVREARASLEAAQGQIEELRTTLADERARGETQTSSQTSEVEAVGAGTARGARAAAATKEEADMTVESMRGSGRAGER